MESTRPIHALLRGLDVLTVLNLPDATDERHRLTVLVRGLSHGHDTPPSFEPYSAPLRAPLLDTAEGRATLAFCPSGRRDSRIDMLARSDTEEDAPSRAPRADAQRMWSGIKDHGYAASTRTRDSEDEVSIGAPVTLHDCMLAALVVRFSARALPLKSGHERLLPKLHRCAGKISTSILEQRAGTRTNGAPEAAA